MLEQFSIKSVTEQIFLKKFRNKRTRGEHNWHNSIKQNEICKDWNERNKTVIIHNDVIMFIENPNESTNN
jgi:hypothetical protein